MMAPETKVRLAIFAATAVAAGTLYAGAAEHRGRQDFPNRKECGMLVVADQADGYHGTDINLVGETTKMADRCAVRYPDLMDYGSALESAQRKERIKKMQAAFD